MILSPGQFYSVTFCKQMNSIQLDIILDKSMKNSAANRKELVTFFQSTLQQILQEMMPAAAKPIPYVDCPYCPKLHIKYTNLFQGGVQVCNAEPIPLDYYQDLFKNIEGI